MLRMPLVVAPPSESCFILQSMIEERRLMSTKYRVLIVDDEPDVLLTLRVILEAAGFEPSLAADGETALRRIDEQPLDVVLLDIMMPVLDGWFVLAELQGRALRPQVIVCSAKTADADRERALNLGAAAYVTKPYSPDDLIAKIHTVLAQGEAHVSV